MQPTDALYVLDMMTRRASKATRDSRWLTKLAREVTSESDADKLGLDLASKRLQDLLSDMANDTRDQDELARGSYPSKPLAHANGHTKGWDAV